MMKLARDAALLLALTLLLGAVANQVRPHRLAWWGEGQQPPMVNVDFLLLDVGTAETLRSSLPGVVVVDTRPAAAAATGRIPGAWHVEYTELDSFLTADRLDALRQAGAVILYGLADEGDIEQLMAQELHRRGVQPPYVMVGGFPAWEAAGFEVEVAP
ncbi:MAG: rhodanese-like domain-containing protein [Thermoanaerobaculaceae bacterium]